MELKNPVSYFDKNGIIYKIDCFFERSCFGQTSRHQIKKDIKYIRECILKFIKEETNNKTKGVINVTKRSSIAEHLIYNIDCGNLIIILLDS